MNDKLIIKLKRSDVEGKVPTTGSLEFGELAVNTFDGRVFFKRDDGVEETIQHILTTNSTTTGSVDIFGSVTQSDSSSKFIIEGVAQFKNNVEVSGSVSVENTATIQTDGVIKFEAQDTTPPPVEGGIFYSGSFYVGLV